MLHTALVVTKVGVPLSIDQRPIPHPKENHVIVQVKVVGLNPHDQTARDRGIFIADSLPTVLGNDVVGIVTELGPSVVNHKIGDRIVGHSAPEAGSLQTGVQEYVVLDVPLTTEIPPEISDDEAATLPTNVIAPPVGLFSEASGLVFPAPWIEAAKTFDSGAQTVFIIGGGSACREFSVQLVQLAGISKIIVVGSERSKAELVRYGATQVIMRDCKNAQAQVQDSVENDLIYAIDCVSAGDNQLLVLDALSTDTRGRMARLVETVCR